MAGPRKPRLPKLPVDLQSDAAGVPVAAVGPGVGSTFVKTFFPLATHDLRIATGYFSVRGYEIGLASLTHGDAVRLQFLVGPKEGVNVREAIGQRIRAELARGDSGSLVDAVLDILARIKAGTFAIGGAGEVRREFHCKFYISDAAVLWHGSANFSKKGLLTQAEQVAVSWDADRIGRWTAWFDDVMRGSENLLDIVARELNDWLKLSLPKEAYLKALALLFGLTEEAYAKGAFQPAHYQQGQIAWALRRLHDRRGALLVVATGLGKTVIGAEIAARLWRTREIDSILLIAPKVVHSAWERQVLKTRKLPARLISSDALFLAAKGHERFAADAAAAALADADERTLILIDEAHQFRNELQRLDAKKAEERVSKVFERMRPALAQGAGVVLLTGSVYATDIRNVNSLLRLLPPPAAPASQPPDPWTVETYPELARLPVVSVLSFPHVLQMTRLRGDLDAEGHPFIEFRNKHQQLERNYLPRRIRAHLVRFRPLLAQPLLAAADATYFSGGAIVTSAYSDETHQSEDFLTDILTNKAVDGWLSSPPVLLRCLKRNLATDGRQDDQIALAFSAVTPPAPPSAQQGRLDLGLPEPPPPEPAAARTRRPRDPYPPYGSKLRRTRAERAEHLTPLVDQLDQLLKEGAADTKLHKLLPIINERCQQARAQVIIFVELYETADYLERQLKARLRGLKVASTVARRAGGHRFELKSADKRKYLQGRFAPRANDQPEPADYQVLICTDADGVGVNLQDADTVVNYDLSGGADTLVQRLGRILRPTTDASRLPYLYTFAPEWPAEVPADSRTRQRIDARLDRFRRRVDKANAILQMPTFGAAATEDLWLDGEIEIAEMLDNLDNLTTELGSSSTAEHLMYLDTHRKEVEALPPYVTSAAAYDGPTHRLILVLGSRDRYHCLVYDLHNRLIESEEEADALHWLRVGAMQPERALVKAEDIIRLAEEALNQWATRHEVALKKVQRLVTLYLAPRGDEKRLFQRPPSPRKTQ